MKYKCRTRCLTPTTPDGKKIIVRQNIRKRFYDNNGILNIGVVDFLLDETAL